MSAGPPGIPFVVAAPSGTGKTTVCLALRDRDPKLVFSVSHTTRPRRPNERDGVDYHFVSEEEFQRLVSEGAFLEWAIYNGNRYGTSWKAIQGPLAEGRDVLLEIEVQGRQLRERLPTAPVSAAPRSRRLQRRGRMARTPREGGGVSNRQGR